MNIAALLQVKAFARQDGVFLALLWIAGFLLMMLVPTSSWGNLITLSTPFFVGWLLIRFRNNALDGELSFLRGYVYSCYTFFYASLIFAVAQYIFLRYFDNGALMTMLLNSINVLEAAYKESKMSGSSTTAELRQALSLIGQMSPIQLTFTFMMQNLFFGAILSLPIAFFCKKKKA
ncbi:MAG: DUF4199 domain-containing protein [Prevotella sp.]|nr:DUF4199 domain-containing protein [Prevotella sp.]